LPTRQPDDTQFWVVARTKDDATTTAKARFPLEDFSLEQDEDVLDTWFSSGLWPFSIMGWPDQVRPIVTSNHPACQNELSLTPSDT
jgi:valyl-tRNA synthetase